MSVDTLPNNLWLPGYDQQMLYSGVEQVESAEDLLLVQIDGGCTESEFENMLLLNQGAVDFMAGDIPIDMYQDMLHSCGIDPEWWIRRAEWIVANLAYVSHP